MTPKEKATELVERYHDEFGMLWYTSKKCALIAVDEIMTVSCGNWDLGNGKFDVVQYWQQVKQEIEQL